MFTPKQGPASRSDERLSDLVYEGGRSQSYSEEPRVGLFEKLARRVKRGMTAAGILRDSPRGPDVKSRSVTPD
jgi:hypothetical protein